MRSFNSLGKKKVIIGLVHLLPLPGTPFYQEENEKLALDKALADAKALEEGGADGCLIQTVDRIYPLGDAVDYARIAAMANIVHAVSQATGPDFQIGVQIMWNALNASLAVAKVCGGSFLRCSTLIGATMTPAGIAQSNAIGFHNYRTRLGAEGIKLIAEVESMHFQWLHGKPVAEVADLALRADADAVEVAHPDEETNAQQVCQIKEKFPDLPVILGGHTNHENAARRLAHADGAFVGSCFETGGWGSHVDADLVRRYVDIVAGI